MTKVEYYEIEVKKAIDPKELWNTNKEQNKEILKKAGVDFSTVKREVINICDSAC